MLANHALVKQHIVLDVAWKWSNLNGFYFTKSVLFPLFIKESGQVNSIVVKNTHRIMQTQN